MTRQDMSLTVDDDRQLDDDVVHLARMALTASDPAAQSTIRTLARRYRDRRPTLSRGLIDLLRESPLRGISRGSSVPKPLDADSRLPLINEEYPVPISDVPILPLDVETALTQLTEEHLNADNLLEAGLHPTRTALFVGPPGVGKTMASRWIAYSLDRPLVILDLASVMSSFLGRTGVNVKRVLDYAKKANCVLLLDELDAVAKRRDDATEVGELKRLVTVLLQEIDNWPHGSILLAATNHAELLDPAVWRRFESIIDFPLPSDREIASVVTRFLDNGQVSIEILPALVVLFRGMSPSDIEREIMRARRLAVLKKINFIDAVTTTNKDRIKNLASNERINIAVELCRKTQLSQRRISNITAISRDTLRKHTTQSTAT
ncbi:AAA family ATPase [Actinomadura atramentaria]|uniref:AAA family ATPase n=1 Tax=Actinomadura atramentaria TaxID=1990 RepID=UPI0009FE8FE6|nr:ATP-binding protein [Actinomadura atramentaria]